MKKEEKKKEEKKEQEKETAPEQAKASGKDGEKPQAEDLEKDFQEGAEKEAQEAREDSSRQEPEEASDEAAAEEPGETQNEAAQKDPREEKIGELTDRLTRQMAEFDNFRKRTEKEKAQMYEIGARDILERILPVVDNFERGLESLPEAERGNAFAEGMEKIYQQFVSILEALGVKPIEALGKTFNPDFHNAVLHVEDEKAGENEIVEELQKGYLYRDTVLRHSMVKVAN